MINESQVREYYDTALECYEWFLGVHWHHGDPEAAARGATDAEACIEIENAIVRATGIGPGGWGLDFGCGIGGPTLQMAKVSGARFVGVSLNEPTNLRARARAVEAGLSDQVSFLTIGERDYTHLPFPTGSLDAVTFFDSVCHLPDKAAFFKEAARVLKPGGRIAGIDWLQRPFGAHQTEEQIMVFMKPVNDLIRIPWHGTLEGYASMLRDAELEVQVSRDLWEGRVCPGTLTQPQRPDWKDYRGPDLELFETSIIALDAARTAGVFTGGMWVAAKP